MSSIAKRRCGKGVAISWSNLEIPDADFDINALQSALDARRAGRGMSWKAVAREINRADQRHSIHPISASTISSLQNKRWGVEGDGVLQMLLWLDRTPESFVPGHPGAMYPEARLPQVRSHQVLRFDVPSIYARLEVRRNARGLSWKQVAAEIGGLCTAERLKNMAKQRRTSFPYVMRLARWLQCPAAALTYMADR